MPHLPATKGATSTLGPHRRSSEFHLGVTPMLTQDSSLPTILARLDKLDRQNRRFKRVGTTFAFLALTATLLMGQAPTEKVVEANEFILRDSSGKIRAKLGVLGDLASLELYDSSAKSMASLVAGTGGSSFALHSTSFVPAIEMNANDKKAELQLNTNAPGASTPRNFMALTAEPTETNILLGSLENPRHGISLTDGDTANSPVMTLFDADGFESDLGVTQTTVTPTGQQRKTSAASLVLVGKEGHVLWSAP